MKVLENCSSTIYIDLIVLGSPKLQQNPTTQSKILRLHCYFNFSVCKNVLENK